MSEKLTARIRELQQQIATVEQAQPPIVSLLTAEMRRFDRATEQFRREPYKQPLTAGALTWASIEFSLMGLAGTLIPGSREHFEQHAAAKLRAYRGLRLSEEQKAERVEKLAGEVRRAEATLEIALRKEELHGEVLPRTGINPEIWLLHDADLAALANGKKVAA